MQKQLQEKLQVTLSFQDEVTFNAEYRKLCDNLDDERFIKAFSRLLNYIQKTQKRSLDHLQPAKVIELKDYLTLDMFSKRKLQLKETILKNTRRDSLLWVIERTMTSIRFLLLKKWFDLTHLNKQSIEERLKIVNRFYKHFLPRDPLRETLNAIYDLDRLPGQV